MKYVCQRCGAEGKVDNEEECCFCNGKMVLEGKMPKTCLSCTRFYVDAGLACFCFGCRLEEWEWAGCWTSTTLDDFRAFFLTAETCEKFERISE